MNSLIYANTGDTAIPGRESTLVVRFDALDEWLLSMLWVWQPQPFKQQRPDWCESYPQLTHALLALSDLKLQALMRDDLALVSFLAGHIAEFSQLPSLLELPEQTASTELAEPHLDWEVPGRKWQQVDRFVQAIGEVHGPVLEWCGGKGHLGRVLALRKQVSVTTLERDTELCEEGERLARRAGVQQVFQQVDVLVPHLPALTGLHPVALHACGELHRTLVRRVVDEKVAAVDIAPCCYHLGSDESYRTFNSNARLQLSRDDLRLAVTGHATASQRELRIRDQEMAWKLGFIQLRKQIDGDKEYRGLRSVDKRWLKLGFEGFCQSLAARESLQIPPGMDWSRYETLGWQRQQEVMRLSLPRHAVRRALELWLVLDMAIALERAGYAVHLQRFCPSHISPRNILLSARKLAA